MKKKIKGKFKRSERLEKELASFDSTAYLVSRQHLNKDVLDRVEATINSKVGNLVHA